MALAPGTRLGPYSITASIGAGGMGEVYKATDTRLNRTVAVKVLPEHVAADPELKQRFEREAQTLAALSHPHICPVFDVGTQAGIDFLVMEYLEGETLEQRLKKGGLSLNQGLQIGIQIADALAAAHRAGIIHRDLKPGNVMLTKSGAQLLDFGLAKLHPTAAVAGLSVATTVSKPLTGQGTILGTLHYMAPEQVEGKEADNRSDIFSFGAVVYEMVTGKRAFEGKSAASVIAAILEREPPAMSTLQPLIPSSLDHVVSRCLAKDPDYRWHTARDLLEELRWVAEPAAQGTAHRTEDKTRRRLAWAGTVAGIALAMAVGVWMTELLRTVDPASVMRFTIPVRSDYGARISPDGTRLAYVPQPGGVVVRQLNSTTDRPLKTGIFITDIEWSPDSQSVAASGQGQLVRVNVQDEQVQVLCALPPSSAEGATRGIAWSEAGTIIFSAGEGLLYQIPAAGGSPTPVTALSQARGDVAHGWPQFLPDNRRFIFWVQTRNRENTGIYVGSLDSQESTLLLRTDVRARLAQGHLLFVREGALLAQKLDTRTMLLEGDPVSIANEVGTFAAYGSADFSASETGILVHSSASSLSKQRELRWFDRDGTLLGRVGEAAPGFIVNLSPDQSRVATTRYTEGNANIWITDVNRNVSSRLGAERTDEFDAQWAPDGARIAFSSNRNGPMALFQQPVAGGPAQLLQASDIPIFMSDWSRDGQYVLYHQAGTKILALPMSGGEPIVVLDTPFKKDQAKFSPDTRWIAYNAPNSGRYEVYVTSFPRGTEEILATKDGGVQPRWRADGGELFFLDLESRLMSVDVRNAGGRLEFGVPRLLFQTQIEANPDVELYDVTRDGRRFIMMVPLESLTSQMNVIVNWPSTLAR